MVYTSILIHSARMKTKGKELVKISDSCAHVIFPVAVNININTVQTLVRLNKKYIKEYINQELHRLVY